MLIVGTGGQAMDSYEILSQLNYTGNICFFNNVEPGFEFKDHYFKKYTVIHSNEQLINHFNTDPQFLIGVGTPKHRRLLYNMMIKNGGIPYSLISPNAHIGKVNNILGEGITVMNKAIVTINTKIGKGSLINANVTITHDCQLGEFVEIGPGVNIAGACIIKENAFIGTGACLIPKITIGENAIVAAGAVVIKDVPPFTMVAGNPAVIKKNYTRFTNQ